MTAEAFVSALTGTSRQIRDGLSATPQQPLPDCGARCDGRDLSSRRNQRRDLDWAVSQFLSENWELGVVGFRREPDWRNPSDSEVLSHVVDRTQIVVASGAFYTAANFAS
jgi:hypothetical protein